MFLNPESGRSAVSAPDNLTFSLREVRALTERLCAPLEIEDYGVQSMPDASPAKWHLAHTTWFFETFVLAYHDAAYRPFHPQFRHLFNSYYNTVGPFWPRARRGLLSRPTVAEVFRYRRYVDALLLDLLREGGRNVTAELRERIVLGLHHEQQHQELLLTDLKHAFACNPLRPAYRMEEGRGARGEGREKKEPQPLHWLPYSGGVRWIGHEGNDFAYDNEKPRHRVFVESFQLASRLVNSGEYRAFIEDGGYQRPELWLSDGWAARCAEDWQTPLYWERHGESWLSMTLGGLQPVRDVDPVCHVSYYEADAFARWAGVRLPTEAEWETAARECPLEGAFLDGEYLHPRPASTPAGESPSEMFGEAWQWTASPYIAYPGYRSPEGAFGEYNAKFFINNMVLRGGSCVTPRSHMRKTYRNFFLPHTRWQFTGIRLAKG